MFTDKAVVQERQISYHYNVHQLCNGVLAGMVSVTASCKNIDLWAAATIGIIGSQIYIQTQKFSNHMRKNPP